MSRRTIMLMVLGVAIAAGCFIGSTFTERAIPTDLSLGAYAKRVYAYVARDESDLLGHGAPVLLMPEAFAPGARDGITVTMQSDTPEYRTLIGVPVAADVRCGVGILEFARDGTSVRVPADIREKIIDHVYNTRAELAAIPRDAFTSGRFSIQFPAGMATVLLRLAGSAFLAVVAFAGVVIALLAVRRSLRVADGQCAKCGYARRGLSPASLCPECGSPSDTKRH